MKRKLVTLMLAASVAASMVPMSVFADAPADAQGDITIETVSAGEDEIIESEETESASGTQNDSVDTESVDNIDMIVEDDTSGADIQDEPFISAAEEEIVTTNAMMAEAAATEKFAPLDIEYIDETSYFNGTFEMDPVTEWYFFDKELYGFDEDDLTPEESEMWRWRQAIGHPDDGERLEIRITDRALEDYEKDEIANLAAYGEFTPGDVFEGYRIQMYLDGEPISDIYGEFNYTIDSMITPEGANSFFVYENEHEDASAPGWISETNQFAYSGGTATWSGMNLGNLEIVVVSGSQVEHTNAIDLIEIDGAKLSFKAGDKVVFAGSTKSDLYNVNESWSGKYDVYSSVEAGDDTFRENDELGYNLSVTVRDDAYTEGYYFPYNVAVKLNGTIYDTDDKYVENNGRSVQFWNLASFKTGAKAVASASAATVKKITPKVTIASAVYNGKAQKPAVTVKDNNNKVIDPKNYIVSYPKSVNAGTYKATVTLKGEYAGSATASYTIKKASNKMSVKAKTVKAASKKKKTIKAAKAFTVKNATGKVTYKKVSGNKKITISKAGKITVKKGLKTGKTYKVKVKVAAAGNNNYNSTNKTITLKVKVK